VTGRQKTAWRQPPMGPPLAEKRAQFTKPPEKREAAALIISKPPHGLFLATKYQLP